MGVEGGGGIYWPLFLLTLILRGMCGLGWGIYWPLTLLICNTVGVGCYFGWGWGHTDLSGLGHL